MRSIRPFILLCAVLLVPSVLLAETTLEYNKHIRPILSDKCFNCHGPDSASRKADLRLDQREAALADNDGTRAIVPGDLEASELIYRITDADPDELMPPEDHPFQLTAKEIATLKQWVKQGAAYQEHWAYIPPVKTKPKTDQPTGEKPWGHNGIDRFILERLHADDLKPAPEAAAADLLRRASFDLTGLPPSPDEMHTFINDQKPGAYERAVDRLLDSPRYGERMALWWLDAARYADTDGYQNDGGRTMWPWRDWVIKAFNDNMPFDQFTIEQLAGDMLPDATRQQKLASGFNRNHRLNNEGGALPEEFIVEYSIDRMETTYAIWQGLTIGCARCHDHKYDAISQKEFFEVFAYWNAVPESGKSSGNKAPPIQKFTSPLLKPSAEEVAAAEAKVDTATKALATAKKDLTERLAAWEKGQEAKILLGQKSTWSSAQVIKASTKKGATLERQEDLSFLSTGENPGNETYTFELDPPPGRLTAVRLEAIRHNSLTKAVGFARSVNGNFVLTEVELELNGKKLPFASAKADFSQANYAVAQAIDGNQKSGWAVSGGTAGNRVGLFKLKDAVTLKDSDKLVIRLVHGSQFADHNVGCVRLSLTGASQPGLDQTAEAPEVVIAALKTPAAKRSPEQTKELTSFYADQDKAVLAARKELAAKRKRLEEVRKGGPEVPVMIMAESDKVLRPTYLLNRGEYDKPDKSEVIGRGVPRATMPGRTEVPGDRLSFARWLASDENPLTARVTVNRFWQMHFGRGIVKTTEDFGSQGEWPSHPELLDWLAVRFMESGWDKKALHRLIVTSATYRQASQVPAGLLAKDPENRLLGRGARYRLDPAAIRDQALFASGLMNGKIGGPPVKPYQPDGLWNATAANGGTRYKRDSGENLYRLSLYTYWKRTVGPPMPLLFDASPREICSVRAKVTNTPLQALALMNDVTFLEAARVLAARAFKEEKDTDARLRLIYERAAARPCPDATLAVLKSNHAFYTKHFTANKDAANAFIASGDSKRDASIPAPDHAALMATAHLVLNLDEVITKE